MGTREFREKVGHRIDAAHFLGESTIVEKNGEPRAVLVPYGEWLISQAAKPESPGRSG